LPKRTLHIRLKHKYAPVILSDEGLTNLIIAMFRYVAQDIRYGNATMKKDALKFLKSQWCKEICVELGMDYHRTVDLIKNYSKVSWRNGYE
jgi:hypothetical protein